MIREGVRSSMVRALVVLTALLSPSLFAATIIHTNDILGELEPCGCRSNPLGGMARERNLLKNLGEKDTSLLKLDAGDLLFPSATLPELLRKQSELQASYLLKALDLLKQDALVPGEKDFALGLDTLLKLKKKASVKFLAANLRRRKGGKVFDPHAIFVRGNGTGKPVRIAVIGLVGDELAWPAELKVSSPIAAARSKVRELRKKADFIVALTHQGYEKDLELARAVKGIDLIIGGHTQSFLQKPVKEGSAWIYQSSFRNQYIGVIPLAQPLGPDHYQLIGLDSKYDTPNDAALSTPLSSMDQLVKDFKSSLALLNSQEEAAQGRASASADRGSVPKFHTFPQCAKCHLKQFEFWRKTPHAHAFQVLVDKKQSSNKECLSCHTVGLGDPAGFSDVNQLAEYHSLPKGTGEAAEPSTGNPGGSHAENKDPATSTQFLTHGELASFLNSMSDAKSSDSPIKIGTSEPVKLTRALESLSRAWTPVQCENCHQPGGNHPFSGAYSKTVAITACLKCHTADKAPEWYSLSGQLDMEKIQAKRAKVTCPTGDLSPEMAQDAARDAE